MMKLKKSLIVILFLALFHYQFSVVAQGPECCDRHALITSFNSNDAMQIIGSHEESHDAYCSSMRTSLAELMTSDCFHFVNSEFVNAYRQMASQEGWSSIIKPSNVPEHESKATKKSIKL